ncbi:DUF3841 domain-containing protein [Stomatobaculum longum]|uniref:DUF3841 domain-containing protein n=1 Tax=Stomatobaculum longum TaxID=796942 RepID=UPI0028E80FC0|nr:DUF3841 domain-containing protein [Stomatobaculum longum]
MILWTSQEEAVYNELLKTGVYRCDLNLSSMRDCRKQYDWLVRQMKQRIGPPPDKVSYPVWAWYQQQGKHRKTDLRRERWEVGYDGERFACIEIEIPDRDVLLSDFDAWCMLLSDFLISDTEQEGCCLEAQYEALSPSEKRRMKEKNWERVFDLSPLDNSWPRRGYYIQATFWELRLEQVRDVRFFRAAAKFDSPQ